MTTDAKTSETGANGRGNKASSKSIVSRLNGGKSATKSTLTNDFNNVLADIEILVKDLAQLTGDDLVRASVKLNEHIATARNTVEAMGDTLTERANQTVEAANDYVRREPLKAIGISASVGLVLGLLLKSR